MDHCCFYCAKPCQEICNDCQIYAFCSPEHKEYHQVNNTCLPFKVERNEELGRYMVATRPIKAFEPVVLDQALAFGPCEHTKPRCLACLKLLDEVSTVCPECNLPMCDLEGCLYPNAAVHEPECLIFRRHQPKKLKVELDSTIPHPLYAIVVPLRLLALRNSNPAKWDLAQDLDSHLEERYNDAKFLFVIATAMPILRACGVSEDDINLVAKILGIGWTNAVQMPRLPFEQARGHALFPIFSMLAHNCMANCRYVASTDGRFVTVRALRHIHEGEQLSIDYNDVLLGNFERRKAFLEHWHFNCRCQRCGSATEMDTYLSAVRCPDKDGYLLPTEPLEKGSDWKCDRCGKLQPEKWVDERTTKFQEIGAKMSLALTLQDWEDYLKLLSEELHPTHYIAMNVKLVISQQLGTRMALDTTEQIRRKLELCQNYLEVYDKVSRGYTKWRGRLMEQLSSAEIKMGIHQFQEGQIGHPELLLAYKKSLKHLKDATKCRQFEPEDDLGLLSPLLKDHNEALAILTTPTMPPGS